MSDYIIPIFIALLLIYSAVRRVPVFNCFIEGAKDAARLVLTIFPYLAAIFIVISLFKISGLSSALASACEPFFNALGIPEELTELIVVRSMSGSGSIALLEDIYTTYGADSYPARCASVIVSSSETVFYIAALYFSNTKVKKMRYAVPVALISTFIGVIISCLLCRIM